MLSSSNQPFLLYFQPQQRDFLFLGFISPIPTPYQMASISLFPPSALSEWGIPDDRGWNISAVSWGEVHRREKSVQTQGRTPQTPGPNGWLEGIREAGLLKIIGNIGRWELEFMFPLRMILKSRGLSESQFFICCHPYEMSSIWMIQTVVLSAWE